MHHTVRADGDRVRQRRRIRKRRVVHGLRLCAGLRKVDRRRQRARDDGVIALRTGSALFRSLIQLAHLRSFALLSGPDGRDAVAMKQVRTVCDCPGRLMSIRSSGRCGTVTARFSAPRTAFDRELRRLSSLAVSFSPRRAQAMLSVRGAPAAVVAAATAKRTSSVPWSAIEAALSTQCTRMGTAVQLQYDYRSKPLGQHQVDSSRASCFDIVTLRRALLGACPQAVRPSLQTVSGATVCAGNVERCVGYQADVRLDSIQQQVQALVNSKLWGRAAGVSRTGKNRTVCSLLMPVAPLV